MKMPLPERFTERDSFGSDSDSHRRRYGKYILFQILVTNLSPFLYGIESGPVIDDVGCFGPQVDFVDDTLLIDGEGHDS